MTVRPEIQQQQNRLDALARKHGWTRGRFDSWKVKGFTVAIGGSGIPRKYIASRGGQREQFKTLEELEAFILPKR